MKKLIASLFVAAFAAVAECATPGTAGAFVEINPYRTPIVTNAEYAVWEALKPVPITVSGVDTNDEYNGHFMCSPNRLNVITNDWASMTDFDAFVCDSIGDYRSWEIYFGPEYKPLITNTASHVITVKFLNGIVANNSTNDMVITNVPAILRSKQLLGKKIWIQVEYPDFEDGR